jgi:nitrate reductase NapE component
MLTESPVQRGSRVRQEIIVFLLLTFALSTLFQFPIFGPQLLV